MKLKYLDLPGLCVNVVLFKPEKTLPKGSNFYISGRSRYKLYKAKLSNISLMTYINDIYIEFPVVFCLSGHPPKKKDGRNKNTLKNCQPQ